MKFALVTLSLFVFGVALTQEITQVSVKPKDDEIIYNCPKDPDMDTVRDMVENYIEAYKLGHTKPRFDRVVTTECLNTPLPYPYKIVVPEYKLNDDSILPRPFFIKHHEVKNIRKTGSLSYADKYVVDVEIKGKDMSGNIVKFEDRASFRLYKDEDAELLGCIALHSSWERSFIYERCYNKIW